MVFLSGRVAGTEDSRATTEEGSKDAGRTASSHQDPPAEEGRESCTGGDCEHLYSPSLIPRSPLQLLSLAFCNANDGEGGTEEAGATEGGVWICSSATPVFHQSSELEGGEGASFVLALFSDLPTTWF